MDNDKEVTENFTLHAQGEEKSTGLFKHVSNEFAPLKRLSRGNEKDSLLCTVYKERMAGLSTVCKEPETLK